VHGRVYLSILGDYDTTEKYLIREQTCQRVGLTKQCCSGSNLPGLKALQLDDLSGPKNIEIALNCAKSLFRHRAHQAAGHVAVYSRL
jgi:hypothetical protein